MTIAGLLLRARELVAGGWSEPHSRDSAGLVCDVTDEGVTTFSVWDALLSSALTQVEFAHAWLRLEELACPSTAALDQVAALVLVGLRAEDAIAIATAAVPEGVGLSTWLEDPKRKLDDVLVLFDQAINRARAQQGAAA